MNHSFLCLSIFFCSFLALISSSNGQPCEADFSNHSFDIVLVQDATKGYEHIANYPSEHIPMIFDNLQKEFPGTRLGFSTFADYSWRTYDPTSESYKRWSPLVENKADLLKNIEGITACEKCGGDYPDSSLLATSLAVTDAKMDWSKFDITSDNKRRLKVVLLITNSGPLVESEEKEGFPYQGDETDNSFTESPTFNRVGEVLTARKVSFLGLISRPAQAEWRDYVKEFNADAVIEDVAGEIPSDSDPGDMARSISSGLKQIICRNAYGLSEGLSEGKKAFLAPSTRRRLSVTKPVVKDPAQDFLNRRPIA